MVDSGTPDAETPAFDECAAGDVQTLGADSESAQRVRLAPLVEAGPASEKKPKSTPPSPKELPLGDVAESVHPQCDEPGVAASEAAPPENALGQLIESGATDGQSAAEYGAEAAGEAVGGGAALSKERRAGRSILPALSLPRRGTPLHSEMLRFAVVLAVVAGLAAALAAWPRASLGTTQDALALVSLPSFAGRVTAVTVSSTDGGQVPVQLREGKLWPLSQLAAGQRLTVEVTVLRPAWVSWLVGARQVSRFTIETPSVHPRANWLKVKSGMPVSVVFDAPVQVVAFGGSPARHLASPQTTVSSGVIARGAEGAGVIEVAAAARPWERLPASVSVAWFVTQPPQLLVDPSVTAKLGPDEQLTLTFSEPIGTVLGAARPRLTPASPGSWRVLDAHTLAFQPSGLGFGLGTTVRVELPRALHLAGPSGVALTRTLQWRVKAGSTLRLQQLLAQLGYLPLDWQPTGGQVSNSMQAQLSAAASPPLGQFSWQYSSTPAELRALWRSGKPNQITRGAVMVFEDTHHLPADAVAGPIVWWALIRDAIAGRRHSGGYSYVFVHSQVPQSLNLWHDGHVIVKSPGNTGVPAAPTQLGTFQVFEHIPVGTMSGTNPSGSHYDDPGIRWISYFNHGEAIHAFNRASFGTPQSLGCVELPLAAAAKVWPYTPVGTLVTIEK